MKELRRIELLAPARNLECGREAIKHGADAVYIGAARFGARAAAGNSIDDIAELTRFAHLYYARVYVTVNTILKDSELKDTEALIWDLYRAGVDAILVQDMAVLRMNLPPIALHASTQMDVRSVDKVRFLASCGFSRVVLARELSLDEIRAIHTACPDVELECFVHGALCVSYSGQCYASEYCFGRSANRGECAQFCRLPFDLLDADGSTMIRAKHLLSLKDMNRLDSLDELIEAGVVSLKIEGRLKETSYVKNVVAAYSRRLDELCSDSRYSDAGNSGALTDGYDGAFRIGRTSSGHTEYTFTPDPQKSFNRGFTDYFLHGRTADILSPDTPKSIGEPMGLSGQSGPGWLTVAGEKEFHNGDGICFFGRNGELRGYRVNRVERGRLFLFEEKNSFTETSGRFIPEGTPVFRNYDQEFEKLLSKDSADRRISVCVRFEDTEDGFAVMMEDEDGNFGQSSVVFEHQPARNPQAANIRTQLSKLGDTVFVVLNVRVEMSGEWFVPSSLLSELRRSAVERLLESRAGNRSILKQREPEGDSVFPSAELTYLGNVMNAEARAFYKAHGVVKAADAFEKTHPAGNAPVMFCRHCLRFAAGCCTKMGGNGNRQIPTYLKSADGRLFRLKYDCAACTMQVIPAEP